MRQILAFLVFVFSVGNSEAQYMENVGLEFEIIDGKNDSIIHYVNIIYKGSPAEKAGVHAGDILLTVNGINAMDKRYLMTTFAGKPGSTTTLVVQRFSEIKKYNVIRQKAQPRGGAISNTAKMPAYKSVREVDVSQYYSYLDECLVGDCENGKGIYMAPDSIMVSGTYKNGKFNGLMYERSDDYYEELVYMNNKREGKSTTYYDDGTVFITPYKNNKEEGIAILKKPDGEEYEIVYKAGEKISRTITNHPFSKMEPGFLGAISKQVLKEITKAGEVRVVDRLMNLTESDYSKTSFTLNPGKSKKRYHIVLTYLKNDGKVEGYFNFGPGTKNTEFEDHFGNSATGFLTLHVALDPGKTGYTYFKATPGEQVLSQLYVVEY